MQLEDAGRLARVPQLMESYGVPTALAYANVLRSLHNWNRDIVRLIKGLWILNSVQDVTLRAREFECSKNRLELYKAYQ